MPGELTRAGAAVAVRGLAHRYGGVAAVTLPTWDAEPGSAWLVLGPSGSGKSTLLHLLAALAVPTEGSVEVGGVELSRLPPAARDRFRAGNVGIVLQALHLVAHLSARDNVRLARYLAGFPRDDASVDAALAALGLAGKSGRRPGDLSHGERQRIAIARAVVNRPRLVLADEPTASLDDDAAMRTVDLLESAAREHGSTLVIATHDQRVKARFGRQLRLGAA